MRVHIYRPAKSAMQSGLAKTRRWVIAFEPATSPTRDPLMGWTGSADTRDQVRLSFATEKEAVAYAKRCGFEFTIAEPRPKRVKPKSYADNFRWDRPI